MTDTPDPARRPPPPAQPAVRSARPPAAGHATPATMEAIAVRPHQAGSIHTRSVLRPRVDDVSGGRGVLVQVLRIGRAGPTRRSRTAGTGMPRPAMTTS